MKSVVISGSVKSIDEMNKWVKVLKENNVQVYHPIALHFSHLGKDDLEYAVAGATYGYFQKIKKADVMLLFNVGGYAGISTTLELGYAVACSKPILSIEIDPEAARNVLIDEQVRTPEELIAYLGR